MLVLWYDVNPYYIDYIISISSSIRLELTKVAVSAYGNRYEKEFSMKNFLLHKFYRQNRILVQKSIGLLTLFQILLSCSRSWVTSNQNKAFIAFMLSCCILLFTLTFLSKVFYLNYLLKIFFYHLPCLLLKEFRRKFVLLCSTPHR